MSENNPQKQRSIMLSVGILMAVAVMGVLIPILGGAAESGSSSSDGESAVIVGEVVERDTSTSSSGEDQYFVTYRYNVGGVNYTNTRQVGPELYRNSDRGDGVDIRYQVDDPSISDLANNDLAGDDPSAMVMILVVGTMIVFSLVVSVAVRRAVASKQTAAQQAQSAD